MGGKNPHHAPPFSIPTPKPFCLATVGWLYAVVDPSRGQWAMPLKLIKYCTILWNYCRELGEIEESEIRATRWLLTFRFY